MTAELPLDAAGREIRQRADFDERMKQARARAEWEIGDPGWAAKIIGAFLYPQVDAEQLQREKDAR